MRAEIILRRLRARRRHHGWHLPAMRSQAFLQPLDIEWLHSMLSEGGFLLAVETRPYQRRDGRVSVQLTWRCADLQDQQVTIQHAYVITADAMASLLAEVAP